MNTIDLDWRVGDAPEKDEAVARTPIGVYAVTQGNLRGRRVYGWELLSWWPRSGCILARSVDPAGFRPSVDLARAEAQDHFDRTIRSCLTD